MNAREARLHAMSDALREAAVLMAVFPIVDQLVSTARFRWGIVIGSIFVALTTFAIGISFIQGDS